jgi:hypothetical protein
MIEHLSEIRHWHVQVVDQFVSDEFGPRAVATGLQFRATDPSSYKLKLEF